jgi:hypothetical protein
VRSDSIRTESSARRWLDAAGVALAHVADRPALWLAGALAWLSTIGWIPFVVAVVRPPSVAELTYFGAGFATSGLWPFNLVAVAAGAVAVVVVALAFASAGNAVLIASVAAGRPSTRDAGDLLIKALIGAIPVALCVLTIGVAIGAVGPAEFNRPGVDSSPLWRVGLRLAPLIVFGAAVTIGASTLAGLAGRAALGVGSVTEGLTKTVALGGRAGRAGLWHLVVAVVAGLVYVAMTGLLLGVLWAPIRAGLDDGATLDLTSGLLLVGFVAIWLCLVLGGGALHAWASATATILLGGRRGTSVAAGQPQEMQLDR